MPFGTVALEKRNKTILDRGLPPSLCNSQKYNIFFLVTTSQEKRLTLFLWHLWIHHQGVRGRREGEEEGREGGGRLNIMMMLMLMVVVVVMAVAVVAVVSFCPSKRRLPDYIIRHKCCRKKT